MKRTPPTAIEKVLKYDAAVTKKFVEFCLNHATLKTLAHHGKALEYSCHGIVWLACWLAFIWIAGNRNLYEMQLNLLILLVLDILVIAVTKAAVRRRRPTQCEDMLTIGPDKFSFPSGHASRAAFIVTFFTCLHPLTVLAWPLLFAWSSSVAVSRVLLRRHYLLDAVAGLLLGFVEACFLSLIWIEKDTAINIINSLSNDYLPGGEAE